MTVVLDSSAVVALYDAGEPDHDAVQAWLTALDDDLVTTPLTLTELDHVLPARGGERARRALWADLEAGGYGVRWWADALAETLALARRYPFAGLVDASLVALCNRLRTNRIATLDHHFRSMTTVGGEAFIVLPADA